MLTPALLYHKISKPRRDSKVRGAFTPPQRFRRQLTYLKNQGLQFYTASELINHFQHYGLFPARSVALTFVDDWRDNYTNAFPVLTELGINATNVILTASIGHTHTAATTPAGEPG